MFGFKVVREIKGGFADLPHLLVWGGIGTRMDGDLEFMLAKCSKAYKG